MFGCNKVIVFYNGYFEGDDIDGYIDILVCFMLNNGLVI